MNAEVQRRQTVHVRWMIRRDMPYMLDIDRQSFAQPWSEDALLKQLRNRRVIAMVAEVDEITGGFFVYEHSGPQITIHRFAVDPKFRRMGVGKRLVAKLVSKLGPQRSRLVIDVRESNLPAQLFFASQGFRCTAIVEGPWDDLERAYRFELRAAR